MQNSNAFFIFCCYFEPCITNDGAKIRTNISKENSFHEFRYVVRLIVELSTILKIKF